MDAASVTLRPAQVPRALLGGWKCAHYWCARALVIQGFALHFDFSDLYWLYLQVGKMPSYPCLTVFQKFPSRTAVGAQYFSDLEAGSSPEFLLMPGLGGSADGGQGRRGDVVGHDEAHSPHSPPLLYNGHFY